MRTFAFVLRSTCLALLFLLVSQAAQAQFGFHVGPNFNRLSDVELREGQAAFDNRTGWNAEVWLDFDIGPVGVRPGLRYMDAGALYDGLRDENDRDIGDRVSVNMIEVPLNLRLDIGSAPRLTPYVIGGPVLRFPFADDDGLNDDLETIGVAGGLGVGLDVNLGAVRVYPEIAYTFGITEFVSDEFTIAGQDFVADDSQFLNAVMLRIGFGL